jgi:hypothetical protein
MTGRMVYLKKARNCVSLNPEFNNKVNLINLTKSKKKLLLERMPHPDGKVMSS